ncbi:MAG: nucleotide exchange factor GrpE [Chitinophagaceae bacterium]
MMQENTEQNNNIVDNEGLENMSEPKESLIEETKTNIPENTEEEESFKQKYLRLYADFDNYKKRTAKEKMEWLQTAGKDIISSLLEVLDDFERAEKEIAKNSNEQTKQLEEGIELIFGKFKKILEQQGLQSINSIGKLFDTEFHEAITEISAPEESQKGNVIDEIQKGYTLNGKIIRYAKVVVGK